MHEANGLSGGRLKRSCDLYEYETININRRPYRLPNYEPSGGHSHSSATQEVRGPSRSNVGYFGHSRANVEYFALFIYYQTKQKVELEGIESSESLHAYALTWPFAYR